MFFFFIFCWGGMFFFLAGFPIRTFSRPTGAFFLNKSASAEKFREGLVLEFMTWSDRSLFQKLTRFSLCFFVWHILHKKNPFLKRKPYFFQSVDSRISLSLSLSLFFSFAVVNVAVYFYLYIRKTSSSPLKRGHPKRKVLFQLQFSIHQKSPKI